MKRISLISAFVILVSTACNLKSAKAEEEDAYNPYDTSELESEGSISDTIYSMDSVAKNYKLHEKPSQDTKH